MARDVYVNLDPLRGAPRFYESPHEVQHGLVLIEATGIDRFPGAWIEKFHDLRRRVPRRLLLAGDLLLFRGDVPLEAAREVCRTLDIRGACATLAHAVGAPPTIDGGPVPAELEHEVRARARALEFEALLEWNHGVWIPRSYHFLLPSGAHAAAFVKAGQAIASPRDAESLANWLLPHLGPRTGIVADTGTLTPLLLAATTRRPGVEDIAVRIVEGYPQTYLDVATAFDAVASNSDRVVAVLSVNSTGQLLSHLIEHLNQLNKVTIDVQVVILVDQSKNRAWEKLGSVQVERWLPLPSREPPADAQVSIGREKCKLCTDPKAERATVVPIDPASFDQQLPSFRRRVMPDVLDARSNHTLWELCSAAGALGVTKRPAAHVQEWRPEGPMAVKVEHEALLDHAPFKVAVRQRLEQRVQDVAKGKDKAAAAHWGKSNALEFDLVLVPKEESGHPRFPEFFATVFPGATFTPVPRAARDWSDDLKKAIQGAKRVTVLTLGTVTGTSLQGMLVGVQATRRGEPGFVLDAIVVHARPSDKRLWTTLVNSYAGRLLHLWLTYLPDISPLEEERLALGELASAKLSEPARRFMDKRLDLCGGAIAADPIFWGVAMNGTLSPHSIFGEGLGAIATYAAVSSAIMTRRVDDASPPERLVFEVGSIIRSYYDPLILVSMLRWLRPSECWWGPQPGDSIAGQLLERAKESSDPTAHPLLASELLLAAALGKVPDTAARNVILARAATLENDDVAGGAIQLGLALVDRLTAKQIPPPRAELPDGG